MNVNSVHACGCMLSLLSEQDAPCAEAITEHGGHAVVEQVPSSTWIPVIIDCTVTMNLKVLLSSNIMWVAISSK